MKKEERKKEIVVSLKFCKWCVLRTWTLKKKKIGHDRDENDT